MVKKTMQLALQPRFQKGSCTFILQYTEPSSLFKCMSCCARTNVHHTAHISVDLDRHVGPYLKTYTAILGASKSLLSTTPAFYLSFIKCWPWCRACSALQSVLCIMLQRTHRNSRRAWLVDLAVYMTKLGTFFINGISLDFE